MRVEMAKTFSILAHELRSPVAVLQGYIRLLQRQRKEGDPELPMLAAMLDATGRLTAIGRQASDLANWLGPTGPVAEAGVPIGALEEVLQARLPVGRASVVVDAPPSLHVVTRDVMQLGMAVAALVESYVRDRPDGPALVLVRQAGGDVVITIGQEAATNQEAGNPREEDVSFASGGLGLGLVLASHVLDGHGARVTRSVPSGMLEIRLRPER
jgi:two-component system phosphate regulon sensor histidine kinase PhoR